jgi:urea transporter
MTFGMTMIKKKYLFSFHRILLGAAVFLHDAPHTFALIVVGILVSAVARALIPGWLERFNRRFSRWTDRLGERTPLLSGH